METVLKALFLLVVPAAFPVFAQSGFEFTKALAEAGNAAAQY